MSDVPPTVVTVTNEPRHAHGGMRPGEVSVLFTRVWDEKYSDTNVIRLLPAELRQMRDAIDAYLTTHDLFMGEPQ